MAQFDIYIDTVSGEAVAGFSSTEIASLPPFVQGDTISLRIFLLARTSTYPVVTPYSYISPAGLTLQAALGAKVGNATTYYATQFTWTADTVNNCFTAQLALNTTEITNLLSSSATASAYFEVKYIAGGLPTTVMEKAVTINAAVIKGGGTTPIPGQTPVSAEYCNATFLTRSVSGAIILTNPTTGGKMAIYLGDDGAFHAEPVS